MVRFYYPERMTPERYDMFLANGWFRSMAMLYKNDLLCLEEDLLSVVNVRLRLDDFEIKPRQAKNFRNVENRFRVQVGKAKITDEKQALYHLNKSRFSGYIHDELDPMLSSGQFAGFETYEITVHDDDRLIACSFFDIGQGSMAGLMGLFDPEYARYSLGIFTMLKEAQVGKKNRFKYYYPGYVLHGSDKFDYKLSIGRYDFLNDQGHWISLGHFNPMQMPAVQIKMNNNALEEALFFNGIRCAKRLYPFFSMAYNHRIEERLLKYALILELPGGEENNLFFAAWDMDKKAFMVCRTAALPGYEYIFEGEQSEDYRTGPAYLRNVYGNTEVLFLSDSPGETAEWIADALALSREVPF